MRKWQRVAPALGLVLVALLVATGRATAGAWSLEEPVVVMEGGSVIGTAVPVSFTEIEEAIAWSGIPIAQWNSCFDNPAACTIETNDMVFFAFEVALGSQLIERDALCAAFTVFGGAVGSSSSDAGWLFENPDDPSTVNPTSSLISGQAQCLKFEDPHPGPGDRTAILASSFGLGEIENQLANTPNQQLAIHFFRLGGGSDTPFIPVPIDEPFGPPTQVVHGTLFELESGRGNTIDHWSFTIEEPLFFIFDLLSYENTADVTEGDPPGTDIDVNEDGEIAYFDPKIYIFQGVEGSLEVGDAIFVNDDDDFSAGVADGSLIVDSDSPFDSYIAIGLQPGSYVLTVGTWNIGLDDDSGEIIPAEAQAHLDGSLNAGPFPTLFGPDGASSDHGDYQITFGGDVILPEPGALPLNGAALIALAAAARHRRSRRRLARPQAHVPS